MFVVDDRVAPHRSTNRDGALSRIGIRDATTCLAQQFTRFLRRFFEKKRNWLVVTSPVLSDQNQPEPPGGVFPLGRRRRQENHTENSAPWRQAHPRAVKRRASPRKD